MQKQTKTSIGLSNGDFFDFRDPKGHAFDIDCIAHALSNICRYTGHIRKFYSVAEHCVLVSRLVPAKYALEGLMHDASEAYVSDMASPLKAMLPGYRKIEESVQEALAAFYGLKYPFPPEIHLADKQMYQIERKTIANNVEDKLWYTDNKFFDTPIEIFPTGMTPKNAKMFFLSRFNELTKNGKGYQGVRAKAA